MIPEAQGPRFRDSSLGPWQVLSQPGASLYVEALDMTGDYGYGSGCTPGQAAQGTGDVSPPPWAREEELWSGSSYLGHWTPISRPDAVIQARELQPPRPARRNRWLFPPTLERYRRGWNLPHKG